MPNKVTSGNYFLCNGFKNDQPSTVLMEEQLINTSYLKYTVNELIKWAEITHSSVTTSQEFKDQLKQTFGSNEHMNIILTYLKQL